MTVPASSAPSSSATPTQSGASGIGDDPGLGAEVTEWTAEHVTPTGIRVRYRPDPRTYWVAPADGDYVEVPSVTTVLDILHKPALTWWGMKMGVKGLLELDDRHLLSPLPRTEEAWVAALNEHKLTVNHRRDSAADRGSRVHEALELWEMSGAEPIPEMYPVEEAGYVEGLSAFLAAVGPAVEETHAEVMVGSAVYEYAGRYDLRITLGKPVEVVTRVFPKRAPRVETIAEGVYLFDLKTSAGVYDTHMLQLAAYEEASQECGFDKTDAQFVLRVTDDGRYEAVRSAARATDFIPIRMAARALSSLSARRKGKS